MGRLLTLTAIVALLVGALTGFIAIGSAGAQTGSIALTIQCRTTPERTTITNNTDQALNLSGYRLTSLVLPRGEEPLALSGTVAPGGSLTFETGGGAGQGLTGAPIYNNDDPNEGARLTTPFGALTVLCGVTGTNSGTLPVAAPQPTATAPPAATATAPPPPTETPALAPTATLTSAPTATIPATVPPAPTSPPPPTVPLATATAVPPTATAIPPTATPAPMPGLPNTGAGGAGTAALFAPVAAALLLLAGLAGWRVAGGSRRG